MLIYVSPTFLPSHTGVTIFTYIALLNARRTQMLNINCITLSKAEI